jgi:hypothetical protein
VFSLFSINEQLKKLENGQQRWSQDNPTFKLYINRAEDVRRNELLSEMRGHCLERWFLLQLMRKYAGMYIRRNLSKLIWIHYR